MGIKKLLCLGLVVLVANSNLSVMSANAQGIETMRARNESVYSSSEPWTANIDEFQIENGILIKYTGNDENVIIPDGITKIGDSAFQDCDCLENVTIPNSVTSIGDYAFSNCCDLMGVTIPDSVTEIGNCAFEECIGLESVTIPGSVIKIGDCAFLDCSGLVSVNILEGVINLGDAAFYNCSKLVNVSIPSSVRNIDFETFNRTEWLGNEMKKSPLVIVNHILIYGSSDNGEVVIPKDVTSIAEYAFSSCSNLTQIFIPEGVTSIGFGAFYNCSSLISANIPEGITSIEGSLFRNCSSLTNINIPSGVTSIGESAFYGCSSLTGISIPSGVTSIGNYAFSDCIKLSLSVYKDSYAESYAKIRFIKYSYINGESEHTHSYTSKVSVNPGCTTKGIMTYICSECGDTYTKEISALGHKYGNSKTVAATVNKNGLLIKSCIVCGNEDVTTIYSPTTIRLSKTVYTYNGKNQKPSVSIKDSKGKSLISNIDYTVSYPKTTKNVGSYIVTVEFKGCYSGTKKMVFTMIPKGTSLLKVSSYKKGFSLRWKKQAAQTTGYEIAYSTDSSFSKKSTKIVPVNKNKTTSKSITKLKAGRKYYVRIRTYKTVTGKKYYSNWSKVKKITTKK